MKKFILILVLFVLILAGISAVKAQKEEVFKGHSIFLPVVFGKIPSISLQDTELVGGCFHGQGIQPCVYYLKDFPGKYEKIREEKAVVLNDVVYWNGTIIPMENFEEYIWKNPPALYIANRTSDHEMIVFELPQ